MESPLLSKIFQRLLSHEICSRLRYRTRLRFVKLSAARSYHDVTGGRGIKDDDDPATERTHWQQRTDLFPQNRSAEYDKYPMVTADMLRSRRERPKRVKMLMRDFIEGTKRYQHVSETALISWVQIVFTILNTAISRSRLSYSILESLSTSIQCLTRKLFIVFLAANTQILKMLWTNSSRTRLVNCGIRRPNYFSPITERQSHNIWSGIIS